MARLASVAVGGYYPTPTLLLPIIAGHIGCTGEGQTFLDPCAGDGEAVFRIADMISPKKEHWTADRPVYAIEMEATRYEALAARAETYSYRAKSNCLHGDAFRAKLVRGRRENGATVLFLNPPYDLDPTYKRLEERFLRRFTTAVAPGGVLVFVVPFYALKASAATLATYYRNVSCFRFPGDTFDTFKQVVLFANRGGPETLDEELQTQIEGWAADATTIPEMGWVADPVVTAYGGGRYSTGFTEATMQQMDLNAMKEAFRPWTQSNKAGQVCHVEGVIPRGQVKDLLTRLYPLAMPPKSEHIATGIAAGVFNGAVVWPDTDRALLPPLLIKGCFDKDWQKVEEKMNNKGEVISRVEHQRPKLVVTVLDLWSRKYHTLKRSATPSMTRDMAEMTTADLLAGYGRGLMEVLLKQCPVGYDPADPTQHFPLPDLRRPLYRAQEHVARALINRLGGPGLAIAQRRHKSAYLLGEVGSGKSIIALAAMRYIGAKSTLILCPPHLLDSWKEQVDLTFTDATCVVLRTVEDVLAYKEETPRGPRFAILSREAAKLGHAMVGLEGYCPKCHEKIVEKPEELASKRLTCKHQQVQPSGKTAELGYQLCLESYLLHPNLSHFLPPAMKRRARQEVSDLTRDRVAGRITRGDTMTKILVGLLCGNLNESEITALTYLALALPQSRLERLIYLAWTLHRGSYSFRDWFPCLVAGLEDVRAERVAAFLETYQEIPETWERRDYSRVYSVVRRMLENRKAKTPLTANLSSGRALSGWELADGKYQWNKLLPGSRQMLTQAVIQFVRLGQWKEGPKCGEKLYQSDKESFRRVALADFIAKRHHKMFDSLILDEVQEYASDGSAQEQAAHLLTSVGWPMLLLTGTFSNGYASSLFTNTWATDRAFRHEFDRDEMLTFMRRYGYMKRTVQDKDKETGKVVSFGVVSDRIERSVRMSGHAPGVLPLFTYRYLLKNAGVIHKDDVKNDLPSCTEQRVMIQPTPAQRSAYERLLRELIRQMNKDRFLPDVAGKLYGALTELGSYLDRCSIGVGNQEDGTYVIRYPEDIGGGVVARGDTFDSFDLLPKEKWMVTQLKEELASGENVMIFGWHTNLLARYQRIIERECGVEAVILNPAKVPTEKRVGWLNKEIVQKGRRVLICNPATVQTGLNNLVHFSRIFVMENPACNPIIYRQAIGRIDRIGQTRPTKILFPVYEGTLQEGTHRLLMLKVAVSRAVDGLDGAGALLAAGVEDSEDVTGLSVGHALAEWLRQRGEPLDA